MSITIDYEERHGATLLTLSGAIGKDVGELREQLPPNAPGAGPVIVDLQGATLLHRAGFQQLVIELEEFCGERRLCLVCHRPSAVRLLHSWGVDKLLAMFLTVNAALGQSPGPVALGTGKDPRREPRAHVVEFYDDDDFLVRSVGEFVVPVLRGGGAAIVVATEAHRGLLEVALDRSGIDVDSARATGRFVDLDAEETLASFMLDGAPDPSRFEATVGALIAGAREHGRAVRVYGEMVALLWAAGNVPAAIALEDLWNELGRSQQFELLCAYPLAGFGQDGATGSFHRICTQHTTVIPTERYSNLEDGEQRVRAVALMQQEAAVALTERARLEARVRQLEQLATTDPLTGLANRRLFLELLEQVLALARREAWDVAVLFLDLDRFKEVNHSRGHRSGDLLLVEVARRLRAALRENDTVARLGGDEFAILLSGPTSAQEAAAAARRVLDSFRTGPDRESESLSVSCSVGVSRWSPGGGSAEELLHDADLAMYRAKDAGGDRFEMFHPDEVASA